MTSKERMIAALGGQATDKVPVMLHKLMAESMVRSVEKYGFDGILVDLDTVTLAGALGVPVDLPVDEPARCHLGILAELGDYRKLPPVKIENYRYVNHWLEAVRLIKEYVGNEIYVRGNCDQAPFSIAGMVRGSAEWMMDLYIAEEENKAGLLEYCYQATAQFIRLMAQTGCDMLSNGDSPAGPDLIPPDLYKTYAYPYEKRIAAESHQAGLPYTLHICGNTGLILEDMIGTGSDALELDYKTDIHRIREVFRDRITLIGNIDPSGVVALGTPDQVRAKTRELVDLMGPTNRFVLNAGCAIPPHTPGENIRAMIAEAHY